MVRGTATALATQGVRDQLFVGGSLLRLDDIWHPSRIFAADKAVNRSVD